MAKFKKNDCVLLRTNDFAKVLEIIKDVPAEDDCQYKVVVWTKEKKLVSGKDIQDAALKHLFNRNYYGLDDIESDILDKYTGPAFKEWNSILRSNGRLTTAIEALQRVIGKAPKYTGAVFRGLSFKTQEDRDAYLAFFKQPTYTTLQFMSTSKNNASALWFADGNFLVFMRIYSSGTNGAALRSFTGNKDLGEDEVLFRYGTTFVVQESYKPDTNLNPYSWFLKLSEDPSKERREIFEIPAFQPKNQ